MALTRLRGTGIVDQSVTGTKLESEITIENPSLNNILLTAARETANVQAIAATGTIDFDVLEQSVLFYTTEASGNFILNVRANATVTLNSMLETGNSTTLVFLSNNGSTAYYLSNLQVDGNEITPKWQGASAPTQGNADSIDVYTIAVFKTGDNAYTALASQSQFG